MAPKNDEIAGQTFSGSIYSISASAVTIGLGIIRFVLLLKLLQPADFGVMTQAVLFVDFAARLRLPGMDRAVVQKKDASPLLLPTYFSLRIAILLVGTVIMAVLAPVIGHYYPAMPLLTAVLLAYLGIDVIKGFNNVQEAVFTRNLRFDRVSIANATSSIVMTVAAPIFAWYGWGVWSLVIEQLCGQLARTAVFWLISPLWKARFGWDKEIGKWFINFSTKIWLYSNLTFATDRFDDFWIGRTLGVQPLGYYSRAYDGAGYPSRLIANPILSVFFSTFSRLQDDQLRLARAFFRAMSLMVRTSFWFSLIFVLSAPELVQLLGEKWQPIQTTFQIMIIYTMLNPLSMGADNLLIAIGKPEITIRVRWVQMVVFIPAVILLSQWRGIEGVALAADLMMIVGTSLLFAYTRRFIDYSLWRLWLWPTVAMVVTGTAVFLLNPVWVTLNPWLSLFSKSIMITILFGVILLLTERKQLISGWKMVWGLLSPRLDRFRKK